MSAFVRVSGPPNSNFLVGYPGISATLVRFFSLRMLFIEQPAHDVGAALLHRARPLRLVQVTC
jgi:hypothetical protein